MGDGGIGNRGLWLFNAITLELKQSHEGEWTFIQTSVSCDIDQREKTKIELFCCLMLCCRCILELHWKINLDSSASSQDDEGTSLFPYVTPWLRLGKSFTFQDFLSQGDHILPVVWVGWFFFRALWCWVFFCFLFDNPKPTFIHKHGVFVIPEYFWALVYRDF